MKNFTYTVQFEGVAKNGVGRTQKMLITQIFSGKVEEDKHKNYETGLQLSQDTISKMMKPHIDSYCSNENIVTNTVEQLRYVVSSDSHNVILYFNKEHPSAQTSNGSDYIYAYFIENISELRPPIGVVAATIEDGIRLSWSINTRHDGIHIYNEKRMLITTLARESKTWKYYVDTNRNALHEFYVSSYYQNNESPLISVSIRTGMDENQNNIVMDRELTSFQSGVGGGDDLKVSIDSSEGSEVFTYTTQLKGQKGKLLHYGPKIGNEVVRKVFSKGELTIKDEVLSPLFDTSLKGADTYEWSVIVESDNPNVKITLLTKPSIEIAELRYLPFKFAASIKNPTQTPWHPLVHTGYYYSNDKERYLYSEVHVEGRPDEGEDFAQLTFVYNIKATFLDKAEEKSTTKVFGAKVNSDQKLHKIDKRTVEDIMKDELIRAGFNQRVHTLKSYEVSVGQEYPVVLSVRAHNDNSIVYGKEEAGKGCIFAQTDGRVMDYIYETSKVYVEANRTAVIHPAPLQGAPVLVEKSGKQDYQQVFFYDEHGKPTVFHTEQKELNEDGQVSLSYANVDYRSVEIHVKEKGQWRDHGDFVVDNNRLLLSNYGEGRTVLVRYAIKDSFSVDYNFSQDGEFAQLTFYDIAFQKGEDNYIKVTCETGNESSYRAKEVELNPLKTTMHTGFLYISDEQRIVSKVEVLVPNSSLYANRNECIRMRAYTLDSLSDPVSDIDVKVLATAGDVKVVTSKSGMDGMIEFDYTPPSSPQQVELKVQTIEGDINTSVIVDVLPYERKGRMYLQTSSATITPGGNPVKVIANVYNSNQEPATGENITFSTSSGYLEVNYGTTDQQGQVIVNLHATEIPKTGIIEIDAAYQNGKLYAKSVIRIEGYRYYHPDLLIRGNNLIDLYDTIETKKNLGISVYSAAPNEPAKNDIWIDDSDMIFLIQRYELSDIRDKDKARNSLGIHVGMGIPKAPWPNDMIIEDESSGQKKGDN